MYTADELEIRCALAGSPRAEQLIACLEGEIAKRDARIVEMESDLAGTQSRVLSLQDQWRKQDAELAALKAQEPVAEIALSDDGYKIGLLGALRNHRLPIGTKLYAAPVSEAKAQDFDPLVCDYCNAETQDPWHGSGMLNGVESRHIHACSQCRNLLPTAKAQGVVMPEQIQRALDFSRNFADSKPDIGISERLHILGLANLLEKEASLKAAHAQQVSVPDGPAKMQWPEIVALVNEVLGCEAHKYPCERGSIGHEMTGINFNSLARIIDRVHRLNAAPVQQPKCKTCDDNGRIGGPSFYAPDEGGEPCPDCSAPVQQVSVPQCVLDWFEAKQAHVTAVDAYNARLAFVREHMPFGTSVDPEYQIMEEAGRKVRNLVWPMFSGLRDLNAAPAAPAADAWIPVSERLPDSGSTVIAYYLNSYGKGRTIRAQHVEAWTIEAEDVADVDTDCVEYSEQDDCYYLLQGWYECIDNWDEYYRVAVTEGPITHWMPLPAAPIKIEDASHDQ